MKEKRFRLPPLERAKRPGPFDRAAAAVNRMRAAMAVMALALVGMPSFFSGLTKYGYLYGTVSLTDFTQIWAWLLVAGFLIVVFVVAAAAMATGVGPKKILGGVAFGIILIGVAWLGSFLQPTPACVTNCTTGPVAGASVAVSLPSGGYPSGQTLSVSPLAVTDDLVMNSSTAAGAMCLQNGAGASHACAATAHNYEVIPVKLSRTDNINATAGFTICINSIATLTNSSTGIVYSPLGYTAATSSSPGIWKVQWNTGSIGGANPVQPAPQTLSGVACDLVGVPAFGSLTAVLSISLPGSNSTSANFGYLATQYSNYPFTLSVTGANGAAASTPASIPINEVFTGSKSA